MQRNFVNFEQAHQILKLPGAPEKWINGSDTEGVTSIKIRYAPGSYDRVVMEGKFVYCVGNGMKSSPGHPSANQLEYRQRIFYKSYILQNEIPVLYQTAIGGVKLLGFYKLNDVRKRVSDEGFSYFEMKLSRVGPPLEHLVGH